MSPFLQDFKENTLEPCKKTIEVADGFYLPCDMMGSVQVKMLNDAGERIELLLSKVLYVPGLTQRLLSTAGLTSCQHSVLFWATHVTIYLGGIENDCPVTIPLHSANNFAAFRAVEDFGGRDVTGDVLGPSKEDPVSKDSSKQKVDLGRLQHRLGFRSIRSLLMADKVGVWNDTTIMMQPDPVCSGAELAVIRKVARSRKKQNPSTYKYQRLDIDVIENPAKSSLTPKSYYKFYLLIVDHFSRYPALIGIDVKPDSAPTAEQVIATIVEYCGQNTGDMMQIRSDAGCQFDSQSFDAWCKAQSIDYSMAASKHQEQNGVAERTWQSLKALAFSMMLHARVDWPFLHFALMHACRVFTVLPVRDLHSAGRPTTPHEPWFGNKPDLSKFRVLFCPAVYKIYQNNTFQRGARCIHIGFADHQAGYKLYVPSTRQIITSLDVVFDESFAKAVALNHRAFHNALSLRPAEYNEDDYHRELEEVGDYYYDLFPEERPRVRGEEGNEEEFFDVIDDNAPPDTSRMPTHAPSDPDAIWNVDAWRDEDRRVRIQPTIPVLVDSPRSEKDHDDEFDEDDITPADITVTRALENLNPFEEPEVESNDQLIVDDGKEPDSFNEDEELDP